MFNALKKWGKAKDLSIEDVAAKVQHAEEKFESGGEKQAYVKRVLLAQWPKVKSFLINTLIELAIVWAVSKGLIKK